MRIDDYIPGLYYGGQPYASPLPTSSMLSDAWQIGGELEEFSPTWAAKSLDDATLLARSAMSRLGAQVGIPASFVSQFDALVSANVNPDPAAIVDAAASLATNVMDQAFSAMGGVPYVGFVAQAISFAVRFALGRKKDEDPPPPMFVEYDKGTNDHFATEVMNTVGSAEAFAPDWTKIFRPPSSASEWTTRAVQGYQRQWFPVGWDPGEPVTWEGWGLVPGHPTALLSIYSSGLTPTELEYRIESGNQLPPGAESTVPHMTWSERYRLLGDRTWNQSTVLPSYVHAGMAAWQAMSCKTAAIFNVRTTGLAGLWSRYVQGALAEMDRWMATHTRTDPSGEHWSGWAARRGLYALMPYAEIKATGGKPAPSSWYDFPERLRFDRIAERRFDDLRKRQSRALDTLIVAYCSTNQAAFRPATASELARDPKARNDLRRKLVKRRAQLLKHPARYRVNLEDVIDEGFRTDLYESRMRVEGGNLTAEPGDAADAQAGGAGDFPGIDEIPDAQPWGEDGAGSGAGLLLAAAVGGLLIAGG